MPDTSDRLSGAPAPVVITLTPVNDTITTFIRLQAQDLSESQMFVPTETALQQGTRVKIEYRIASFGQKTNVKIVDASAEVLSAVADSARGRRGVLVKFTKVSPNSLALIQKILEKKREALKSGQVVSKPVPKPEPRPEPKPEPRPSPTAGVEDAPSDGDRDEYNTPVSFGDKTVVVPLDKLARLAQSASALKSETRPAIKPEDVPPSAPPQLVQDLLVSVPVEPSDTKGPEANDLLSPALQNEPQVANYPEDVLPVKMGINLDLLNAAQEASGELEQIASEPLAGGTQSAPIEPPPELGSSISDVLPDNTNKHSLPNRVSPTLKFMLYAVIVIAIAIAAVMLITKKSAVVAPEKMPQAVQQVVAPQESADASTGQQEAVKATPETGKEKLRESAGAPVTAKPKAAAAERKQTAPVRQKPKVVEKEPEAKAEPPKAVAVPEPPRAVVPKAVVPEEKVKPREEGLADFTPATVTISSIPLGDIYFDGKLMGRPPVMVKKVTPGEHTIAVRKEGWKSDERTVEIRPGKEEKFLIRLSPAVK